MIGSLVGTQVGTLTGSAVGTIASDEGGSLLGVAFAGQSNAAGFADHDNIRNLDRYLEDTFPAVQMRQQDGTNANPTVWTFYANGPVKPRTNSATLNMGVELALARYLNRRRGRSWFFSKVGIGSSSLADHWLNPAYPVGGPPLLQQMFTAQKGAAGQLGGRIRVFVWYQGEQDATDATDAANYQANLTTLITQVRAQFGPIPVIIVKLHTNNPGAQKLVVRAAQDAVAASVSGVTLISVDDLTLQGDNLHLTSDSYNTCGNRIGAAINTALGFSNLLPSFVPVYRGRTINTTDTSVNDGATITTWDWDWGDGSAHDSTQNASHAYATNGVFSVRLTVTNDLGETRFVDEVVTAHLATWDVDATSGISVPEGATQWAAFIAAYSLPWSPPNNDWPLDDLLNQTDVTGGKTLTAGGVPGTQQAVAGWTRQAVGHTGLITNQTFANGTMPNANANSSFTLAYAKYVPSAAIRQCMSYGAASGNAMETPGGTQVMRLRNSTFRESTLAHSNEVLPFGLLWNRAALANSLTSPKESVKVAFNAALAGAQIILSVGFAADVNHDAQFLKLVAWTGVAAEHSVAEVMALYRALGWFVNVPGD